MISLSGCAIWCVNAGCTHYLPSTGINQGHCTISLTTDHFFEQLLSEEVNKPLLNVRKGELAVFFFLPVAF